METMGFLVLLPGTASEQNRAVTAPMMGGVACSDWQPWGATERGPPDCSAHSIAFSARERLLRSEDLTLLEALDLLGALHLKHLPLLLGHLIAAL